MGNATILPGTENPEKPIGKRHSGANAKTLTGNPDRRQICKKHQRYVCADLRKTQPTQNDAGKTHDEHQETQRKLEYTTQDTSAWEIIQWKPTEQTGGGEKQAAGILSSHARKAESTARIGGGANGAIRYNAETENEDASNVTRNPPKAEKGGEVHASSHTGGKKKRLQREHHDQEHLTNENNDAARLRTLFKYGGERGRIIGKKNIIDKKRSWRIAIKQTAGHARHQTYCAPNR